VNRSDLLHMQIGSPELQAVTKLLDALCTDMRTDVQQKLSARFAHPDNWTVRRAGEIAEEIEWNAAEMSLYTRKSIGSWGPGVTTMLRPGESGNAPAARSDQRTCHQCGKVGLFKRKCPDLNSVPS
jgi:hypothetical protein